MSRYLDDGLDAAGRADMARHLKVCRVCDMELKEHLRMRDLLRGAREEIAPMAGDSEGYWSEVRQRLSRPVGIRPASWVWKAAPVAVAASLALVAVVGFPRAASAPGSGVAQVSGTNPPAPVAEAPAHPGPAAASAPSTPPAPLDKEEPAVSSPLSVGLVGAGGGSQPGSTATRPAAKPSEPEIIWF